MCTPPGITTVVVNANANGYLFRPRPCRFHDYRRCWCFAGSGFAAGFGFARGPRFPCEGNGKARVNFRDATRPGTNMRAQIALDQEEESTGRCRKDNGPDDDDDDDEIESCV